MVKGLFGIVAMTGLFVSVFMGSLAYKLVKGTGIDKVTDADGYQSESRGVAEGQPLPDGT